jgi:hypothetical protein
LAFEEFVALVVFVSVVGCAFGSREELALNAAGLTSESVESCIETATAHVEVYFGVVPRRKERRAVAT